MLFLYLSMLDDPEDQRKFEALYNSYKQMMYYSAYRVLNNVDDAEDAVHQAFLRVINHMDDIDENDPHRTKSYLSIITQNIAIDIYRRKKREWARNVSFEENELFIEDPSGQNFEDLREPVGNRLAEAIAKLPAQYAEVIRLTYAHGYSSDKVGELLGISSDNVRQRLVRARKKLAELLGSEFRDNYRI